METLKANKGPLLLPLLLVILTVAAYGIWNTLFSTATAASCLTLGRQYLSELNFSGAILEFSNAIAMDPCNKDAQIGLAQAYAGNGEYEMASQVLVEAMDEDRPDRELSEELVNIYVESGRESQAVQLIQQLITQTDEDQYYELLQQVLELYFQRPRPYCGGENQALLIQDGQLLSRGSNVLGQLGTDHWLGEKEMTQEDFLPADFPGEALRVSSGGQTSYVVDRTGNLWAAGENRWGQMGLSYGTALPQSGWTCLMDTGDIAAAAGTPGRLLVLRTDGSLWQSGGAVGQNFTKLEQFPPVIALESDGESCYILTSQGKLYVSGQSGQWQLLGSDVVEFTPLGRGQAAWIGSDGSLYGIPYRAGDWQSTNNGGVYPGFGVRTVACASSVILMEDADGRLLRITRDGQVSEVTLSAPLAGLYGNGVYAAACLEDGTVLLWQNGNEFQIL